MGTCQVTDGAAGLTVKCNRPAVATVKNKFSVSYRACEQHAKLMEMSIPVENSPLYRAKIPHT